ncbi:hypothetical protein [Nocardioides sambongensis]|uniref:hypothetical protein n=1 Tax=Nocardioides sambongensis TaxID=2589074 RepID=UPI001E4C5272|nr:hypothetical protein [Nocardioides sambongensis]
MRGAAYLLAWLVLAVAIGTALFLSSERTVDIASHEATLQPDLSGEVVVRTGPVLPDLRVDSGNRVGVEILLGKTDLTSVEVLGQRYATIASAPGARWRWWSGPWWTWRATPRSGAPPSPSYRSWSGC